MPDKCCVTWAHQIRRLREILQLNQMDFAKLLGVAQSSVARYERGTMEPSIELKEKVRSMLIGREPALHPHFLENTVGLAALVKRKPFGEIYACTPEVARHYGYDHPRELRGKNPVDPSQGNRMQELLENEVLWNEGNVGFGEIIFQETLKDKWVRVWFAPIFDFPEELYMMTGSWLEPPRSAPQVRLVPLNCLEEIR